MNTCKVQALHPKQPADVQQLQHCWQQNWPQLSAQQRIEQALHELSGPFVLSSSFGMQAAVMLHLVSSIDADLPVIFIDTGYHFAETYRFVDELVQRLQLKLRVYSALTTPAWQEARYGKRWEQGLDGIQAYNQDNKVEPMQRALRELNARVWFSGLRRDQSSTRSELAFVDQQWGCYKVHPLADWSDRDVHQYLQQHDLPYHPLREQGYLSIGDWHTTRSIHEVDDDEKLRFFGLARECGLHQVSDR
jgi:phosphoadenosine phosphosulfate reductase